MKKTLILMASLAVSASAVAGDKPTATDFFDRLGALCGKAFEGKVAKGNEADSAFANQRLVMHVRECSESQIKVPFHVGDDSSRTWVISKTDTGLKIGRAHV